MKYSKNIMESALINAINSSDQKMIKILLNQGVNPNKVIIKTGYFDRNIPVMQKLFNEYGGIIIIQEILSELQFKIDPEIVNNKYEYPNIEDVIQFNESFQKKVKLKLEPYQCKDILQMALVEALDSKNINTVKEIFKTGFNNNINFNLIHDRQNKSSIFSYIFENGDIAFLGKVYPLLDGIIKYSEVDLILKLISYSFKNNSKENQNIIVKILNDQIKKGLKLSKVKNKEHGNLLHRYHARGNYYNRSRYSSDPYANVVEFLLKNKVSPTEYNSQGKTPFHIKYNYTGCKSSNKLPQLMLDYKIDFNLEDENGNTIISNLIESNLQVKELFPLLKKISLNKVGKRDLKSITSRKKVSYSLVNEYIKRGALTDYKMLEYLFPNMLSSDDSKHRAMTKFGKVTENVEKLLKYDKLKDFLQNSFGISSSNLTNMFLNHCKEFEQDSYANPFSVLDYGLILKQIFMNGENNNPNYFLDFFKDVNKLKFIGKNHGIISVEQIGQFFCKNFTQQQSKILLDSIIVGDERNPWRNEINFRDSIKMYWQFPDQLTPMIKELKFSNINDFHKIHEYLAVETRKLEQLPFDLCQEEHYPMLKEIHQQSMGLDKYTIYVAQSNYDLINWGSALHNCIGGGSYANEAKKGKNILLGVLYDESIKYCIEIQDKEIVQMEGLGRCSLPEPVLLALKKTLKKVKILS